MTYEDAALNRIGPPLGEVVEGLQGAGFTPDQIDRALRATVPLANYCLRLDARLSRVERELRTARQIAEGRGDG